MNFGCFAIKKCISVTVIVGPMSQLTAYNIPILVTFWHFNTISNGFFLSPDSGKLRDQSLWVDFWVSPVNNDTGSSGHEQSTSLARTGAVMFSKNFLALIAGLVHVINYDSEFKLIQLPEPHLCTHNAAQCPLWHIPSIARVRQHLVQDKYVTWPPCSLSKMSRVPLFIQATNFNGQSGIQKQSDNFNSNNLESGSIAVSKLCTFKNRNDHIIPKHIMVIIKSREAGGGSC